MLKSLLSNKEKLLELANTPLNENCSTVILKKLHEKLSSQFLPDFIQSVDYESDPRVPLDLGRPFTYEPARAFVDVTGEEMILRDDYLEDLFTTNHLSGNPTPISNPIVSSSPTLTSLEESDLIWEEFDAYLASDSFPPGSDDTDFDPEGDLHFFPRLNGLPSTNNEDKVFNPGILIHENLFEITNCVKNVKKTTNASLILKDFNPPLYELPFHKEVPGSETLLSFSSENEEKVFNPEILTSKGVHTSLLPELSHRGPKALNPEFEASRAHVFVLRSLELHILSFIMRENP
ncbi:hypothetical protein Tco_0566032 [Tanacetum coccineum]